MLRNDINQLLQLSFTLPNLFFRALGRGDIRHRADKLQHTRLIFYGMGHDMDVFDGTVWKQKPTFKIHAGSVAGGLLEDLLHEDTVLGMDSIEHEFQRRLRSGVIPNDAKSLFRPEDFAARDLPSEAAGEAQSLRLS